MSTFGAMKTDISRKLIDENQTAVADSVIGDAINEAINFWKHKRLFFNTVKLPVSITAGDTGLSLPADFLAPIPNNAFSIVESGFPYRVSKKTPILYDAQAYDAGTGRPLIWVYRGGAIEFYPTANIDYSGFFYYIKNYDDFVTDDSQDTLSNDWTSYGGRLIRSQALSWLHDEERQDEETADRYAKRAEREYNNLLGRTNQLLKTGTLTVEQ